MARAGEIVLRAIACVLLASLAVAAWHDVSKGWDVWAYHLPFAGRLVGLIDPSEYAFGRANAARYQGFPLFAELLQGILWRVTGRPECANLVAFSSLPAMALFLRRFFAVPAHLTILALLAIPLVQIHATSSYIDLPANTWAAMLVLLALRAAIDFGGEPRALPSPRRLAFAGALAAAAANAKFQLFPIVAAAALVLVAIVVLGGRARGQTATAAKDAKDAKDATSDRDQRVRFVVMLAFVPIVLATPLLNYARYGNPVWPVALHLFGIDFPALDTAYSSSPRWLEHAPRPFRFLCSVLEIGMRPIASHARWSLDRWTPPSEDGYRMGGFCGAYVAANVIGLGAHAALARADARTSARARAGVVAVIATTVIVSVLPQSHELRYYMVWMLVLVAVNLAAWAERAPGAVGVIALVALGVVAWSTEGGYLYASGDSFATLVSKKVDTKLYRSIAPGERVCVSRAPWTFLYAPRFHPDKRYAVQAADDPADCAGARPLE